MVSRAQHPCEVLNQKVAELGVSPISQARQVGVPQNPASKVILGKPSVIGMLLFTVGTNLKLS